MKIKYFFTFSGKTSLILGFLLLVRCSNPEIITPASDLTLSATSIAANDGCSSCTYVVPANTTLVDGLQLGLQPGSVIGLSSTIAYGKLLFRNIVGTVENPIIIKNCDGTAIVDGTGLAYSIKTEYSKYFRITGGDANNSYGIKVTAGHIGISLDKLSTNFEVDHVEVQNVGFAGIMAKTDPTCDDATIRGNFLMKNVNIHHNYVHDTGGEGFYVGNSMWDGANTSCGPRLPHEIHNLRIWSNIVKNSGWDGIQVGCASRGARIYNNSIENYGMLNIAGQRNGMQLGGGTGGYCYGNLLNQGTGNGLIVLGLGDNIIYNNIIVDAGESGIFCDERNTPGPGFQFINNTIINPKHDGIRIFAELVPMNVIKNNIIVNPGNYSLYTYPRLPEDAFICKLSNDVRIDMATNYFTTSIDSAQFTDAAGLNYRLTSTSPVIDQGTDISTYNINIDYYKRGRLKGNGYDIGASEY